ncbi:hypothetical protein [uncultured Hyphomonas sp.]|uniref:hypothetical protein n=1 Tax=uncultured Hyphomonas sp. TaxID=225298 RepID=UPI000C62F1B3|nr:hypothetical protein [Hyphomonadaceae bacterium]MBA30128.1 hypothetical protein [Hyphomonadaceae bacterium]QDP63685.1 MAG: hypothetical protein GOVbin258_13 [Prokaryotic dsDNA virus sp.]|tara:strand:+ start:40963 stop:42033 length:1071 start_codon:yes stop_codon:yes gene_type:complete
MTDVQAPPAPAEATIGHNSAAVGEILRENPAAIFDEPDMLKQLVSELQDEIDAADVNLETNVGRNEVISRANGITKLKAAIDKAGLARTEEHRTAVKKVNEVRNQVKETLADLVAAARRPVTEWEAAENARKVAVDQFHDWLAQRPDNTVAAIEAHLAELRAYELEPDVFRGELADAQAALNQRMADARDALEAARKAEEDARELARLREAEEQRLAEEAAKQAEREAAEAEERRKAAEAERIKAAEEKAARDAEQKAREEAEERQRQKDAEAAAALKAERDRAAEAERQLQAQRDAEAAEKAAEEKRKADAEHRERIQAEAAEAIAKAGMCSPAAAADIVTAILAGNVPHVSLKF